MRGIRLLCGAGLVAALIGLGLESAWAAADASWRFHTAVQVRGEYITLADIAVLTPEQTQAHGEFIIWSAPPPGKVYTLTREFLSYRLVQPGGPGEAALAPLPPVIKVKREAVEIGMAQLTEVFRRHVYDHSPWSASYLHIQVYPPLRPLFLPPGKVSYQVIPPPRCCYLGPVTLEVLILQNGILAERVKVSGTITLTRPVVCTKRSVRPRQILTEADVKLVEKEFQHLPRGGLLTDPAQVIGKALRRGLGPDTVIFPPDLFNAPLIKRGDWVTIQFEQGGLVVTARGKAREPGYVGKQIRVINSASKKELQALVVDQKTVKVEM